MDVYYKRDLVTTEEDMENFVQTIVDCLVLDMFTDDDIRVISKICGMSVEKVINDEMAC